MSDKATDRWALALLALALLALLAALLWPVPGHAQVSPPRSAASLLVVSPSERAVTAADLATVEVRLLALEQRVSLMIAGAAAVLGAIGVLVGGGRLRLSAGPVTVEAGGPPDGKV